MRDLRKDSNEIIRYSIDRVLPDEAVRRTLEGFVMPEGRLILVSVGKAAWRMADSAVRCLGLIDSGIIITKYGHSEGQIPNVMIHEASHPILNQDAIDATEQVIEMVSNLGKKDTVLFLLSGGASALFESPSVSLEVLQDINRQLLCCGASIEEINTIRKRLSKVKGGRFAEICSPAKVFSIILSDILDDRTDMIGSGPTVEDTSTSEQALNIVCNYGLHLSDEVRSLLKKETVSHLDNTKTHICGSVIQLCQAAKEKCEQLGYETRMIDTHLNGEAAETGRMIGSTIRNMIGEIRKPTALIYGGETVVRITGNGKGGRNQELALAAAPFISGLDACLFSIGSDGTDGPTDAAGGYVDGSTLDKLKERKTDVEDVLKNNDSYHALQAADSLIITGPTGTNVNDLTVALLLPK
ncbi:MAG: DUF4147 domain-containing protein [Erysipelotrichaceae bacterium]|nr:DUF4147 domain-containing protein [Erysipelotrichaceae bacterium]